MSGLKVLSVASEIFPLIKTGGLADVVGALPAALAHEGVEVRTLVPAYPAVIAKLAGAESAHTYADLFGGPARVLAGAAAGLELFAIDAPHLYNGSRRSRASGRISASERSMLSGLRSFTHTTGRRR
jgi:starch synthase